MPLSLSRRRGSALWQIVGSVAGHRVRQSAGTPDRRLAEEARAELEARLYRGAVYGERAVVTWEQACASYLDAAPRSPAEQHRLLRISERLAGVRLADIGQVWVDQLGAALCRPSSSPATRLREIVSPVRAVLTHAARRQWCDLPAFEIVAGATGKKRTRWLTPEEAQALADAAAEHLRPLVLFLVGCGARIGEALTLDWRDVDLLHARATLRDTKNGRDRIAELPPVTVAALANLAHRHGRVFRPPAVKRRGEILQPLAYADTEGRYGGQIATAWDGACRRAGIEGATPHTLRHTWASWRYAQHRDLLRLKAEGDWSSVALVERYAKIVPPGMLPAIERFLGLRQRQVAGRRSA